MSESRGAPIVSPRWWTESETPRWAIALGAVLTLLMSGVVSYEVSEFSRIREGHSRQVEQLLDSARQFQVFASAFATEMLTEKTVSVETRKKLIENLNDQISRLNSVDRLIPVGAKGYEQKYKDRILQMTDAVNHASDMLSMNRFWTAASNLTVARNELSQKLQDI